MARAKTTNARKPRPAKQKTKPGAPGAPSDRGSGDNGTPPKLSDDEERSLFTHHRTQWNTWKAKLAVVEELERDVKAALKNDGFTVKQFQIADALAGNPKQEAKVREEVRDRLKVARWMGHPMGAQLDMFEQPDRTPLVDRAYDQGKQASMENRPASPPHAPDTEAYRSYMAGFHDHQREIAGGIKAPAGRDDSTLANATPAGEA